MRLLKVDLVSCALWAVILFSLYALHVRYSTFMDDCMKDHKRYECDALYSTGIIR